MYSYLKLLAIVLILSPIVIKSDFCSHYKSTLKKQSDTASEKLKFIPTKHVLYLYLSTNAMVYEFDVSCNVGNPCPKIGEPQPFSKVFSGLQKLKTAFIQNGFTYLFFESSTKVSKFENRNKIQEIDENLLWESNITYATAYKWVANSQRMIVNRFIPPKSTNELRPRYGFSFDRFGNYSVELRGNYESVNLVRNVGTPLYSFGQYLVPLTLDSFLPLPDGDALIQFVSSRGAYAAAYMRSDGMSLNVLFGQDFKHLFGCDGSTINDSLRILTHDYRSDNIHPLFTKK